MTLLFVFKLDDLSDILCSFVGLTDEDFQRLVAWKVAMLSQCPVRLADLIDSQAVSAEKLWRIRYDEDGHLLCATGGPCRTRLAHFKSAKEAGDTSHSDLLARRLTIKTQRRILYHP